MKTILAICGALLLFGSVWIWRTMRMPSRFGEFAGAQTVSVTDLVERPKDFVGKLVSVEGVIAEQCQTMGCYFFFNSGTKTLRVELKEVAMNAPIREGHNARVEGQVMPNKDGFELYASAVEFK